MRKLAREAPSIEWVDEAITWYGQDQMNRHHREIATAWANFTARYCRDILAGMEGAERSTAPLNSEKQSRHNETPSGSYPRLAKLSDTTKQGSAQPLGVSTNRKERS